MFDFKREIIYPKDKKSLKRFEEYKSYYKIKYDICKEINPKLIVEIGVRAGYSAWSFLQACPGSKYIGIDANNGKHGGQGGEDGSYAEWAKTILKGYDTTFINLDTQKVNEFDFRNVDLFHIDGDHSVDGVQHDLNLAFNTISDRGVMLIDYISYIEDVKIGVYKWINKMIEKIDFEFRPSLRGEMLIKRRSHESL